MTGDDSQQMQLERLKSGDEAAFTELVRTHQREVYRIARGIVHDHDDADEVAQRTFILVHRKIGTFRGDATLRTWIYRITVNQAKNLLRERKRKSPMTELERMPDPGPRADDRLDEERKKRRIRELADKLPPVQKAVLTLRIVEELPYGEIARVLGTTVNAAKVNYHHAVKRLKQLVDEAT